MHFEHILLTTDLSEESNAVFDLAAYQAKMENTKVSLMYVAYDWEVPGWVVEGLPNPMQIEKYREQVRKGAEQKLDELAKKYLHSQKIEKYVVISIQPPAQVICEFAKKNSCDLIIMSGHGRGAMGHLLLGSVTQKVIQLAPCPVMVIPRKGK